MVKSLKHDNIHAFRCHVSDAILKARMNTLEGRTQKKRHSAWYLLGHELSHKDFQIHSVMPTRIQVDERNMGLRRVHRVFRDVSVPWTIAESAVSMSSVSERMKAFDVFVDTANARSDPSAARTAVLFKRI